MNPSKRLDTHLTAELDRRLDAGLAALELTASPEQRRQLLDFLALLHRWNGVYNLTSVRDPLDMMSVHLLDSLSIATLVTRLPPGDVLDVGSGAGLPGIPLAIMNASRTVHSIDAVAKKIGFQLHAKASLGLRHLNPVHGRVEALTLAEPPVLIVSRAYADLAQMLGSIDSLSGPETTVLAMKGAVPEAELATVPSAWRVRETVMLDVPFLGARRCAVLLKRSA